MKKTLIYALGAVIVLVGMFYALNSYIYKEKQGEQPSSASYKDITYVIAGIPVKLANGYAEQEAAPGSVSKIVTRYFGNEVRHDLDGDGREDVAFLLTQETGGTGTFFYAVGALAREQGYEGTQAVLIGDRIAPQTTEKGEGRSIIVNYADRAPGQDFSVQPSVGKSLRLLLDAGSMQFGEVVQDFEGEADPSRMTLEMKAWVWKSAFMNDGTTITPRAIDAFTIEFESDGTFSAKTDCNGVGGEYFVSPGGKLSFANMISTKMYCEGSQEADFATLLSDTATYHFTSKGELVLGLKFDSGSVTFR